MIGSLDRRLQEHTLQSWQGALPNSLKSGSKRAPILITCFDDLPVLFLVDESTWYTVDESEERIDLYECEPAQNMVFTPRLGACVCT